MRAMNFKKYHNNIQAVWQEIKQAHISPHMACRRVCCDMTIAGALNTNGFAKKKSPNNYRVVGDLDAQKMHAIVSYIIGKKIDDASKAGEMLEAHMDYLTSLETERDQRDYLQRPKPQVRALQHEVAPSRQIELLPSNKHDQVFDALICLAKNIGLETVLESGLLIIKKRSELGGH